jgi:hypothetical protein
VDFLDPALVAPVALAVFVGLPLFVYIGVPLLILAMQRFNARPKFHRLRLDAIDRPVAEFLADRAQALLALGFDDPVHLRTTDISPGVTAYLIMLVHPATADKAMVTVLIGGGAPPIQTWYVEFSTRFADGKVFNTLNSAELNAFPPMPDSVRTQVPSVTDPEELYELHRAVIDRHAPEGRATTYEPGGEVEFLYQYAFRRLYEEQVRRGVFRPDGADAYRLTVGGAYRLTWGLMPPFKQLRAAGMRREGRRVQAEFRARQG